MSFTVKDYGEEKFETLLESAYACFDSEWEHDFLYTLSEKYAEYGLELFLTDRIIETMKHIAGE